MICETTVLDPITYEEPPDGGKIPIIDPYDGCTLCCPYCWRWSDESWNKNLYVHMNIADLLHDRLAAWDQAETIYLGSRCDPYMQVEETYGLTRKCLSVLNELRINTMITTKSDNRLIFRDFDTLTNFSAEITVLMGMSNVRQLGKGVRNDNILTANKLVGSGVAVWGFITPVLPYIMDVDSIIEALSPDIPVFLDKLRIGKGTVQADNMRRFIARQYPEYAKQYDEIIDANNEAYYDALIDRYTGDSRVKILF